MILLVGIWFVLVFSQGFATNQAGDGEIYIKKYPGNNTCFQILSSTGVRIITDPYQMNESIQADIVTESHQHQDHSDVSRILQPYRLINTWGEFTVKDIRITGIPGHHNFGDQGITNIIFLFDIDGIQIAQFASQGEMLPQETLERIGNVDILIIQIGTLETRKLIPYQVSIIAQQIKAKIVIPAHDTALPKEHNELAALLGNNPVIYKQDGTLKITKAQLKAMDASQVMVLDN